jgi:hypothetical protein
MKRIAGRKSWHALGTTVRAAADRLLKEWIAKLERIDPHAKDLTLGGLLAKFQSVRVGKAESTKVSEHGMAESIKDQLGEGVPRLPPLRGPGRFHGPC